MPVNLNILIAGSIPLDLLPIEEIQDGEMLLASRCGFFPP
jgi:hypothetical protein